MGADRLLPLLDAGFVLGLAGVVLLLVWRRRLPADLVGRVQADSCLAMLRALLVLLAGLALELADRAVAPRTLAAAGNWVATGLIAFGGIAFVARLALYRLRIKPELDRMRRPSRPRRETQRDDPWGSRPAP
jgi:hypothetical protein